MSTLTLEKLPKELVALIREGETIRLTDKGRLIATVAPSPRRKAPVRPRPRKAVSGWDLVKHLAGSVKGPGPSDLSSNPRHLEGLGE